ncbi:hypothetical protein ACTMTJ_20375 [Phytohabitans sp. LJ34]|uniref:hypothetical protein n=1 Tax=Phytohabitans sp. LJ34 TaxID=3452217 RepID=UPI003F88BF93
MPAPVAPLRTPDFDPLAAFPEARALRDAAKAHDWWTVDAGLARFTDPAVYLDALRGVARVTDRGFVEQVFAHNPTSAPAGTLLAWRLVEDGWAIRTGGWARHVSAEQWKGFHEHLHRAEQILIEVTARHPGYASGWVERLHTARGLSLGQAEARRRYDAVMKVAPRLHQAQAAMVQQLCPKWSGSYEAMHRFAVDCTKASPPGSVNGAVVADAHIEHWLLLDRDDGEQAAATYLRRPEVQQELLWAAGHSVLNPACRPAVGWVEAHSSFAMAFSLAENYPAAAAHFNALYAHGNLAAESPWDYLGDGPTEFVAHRDRAFQNGFRR